MPSSSTPIPLEHSWAMYVLSCCPSHLKAAIVRLVWPLGCLSLHHDKNAECDAATASIDGSNWCNLMTSCACGAMPSTHCDLSIVQSMSGCDLDSSWALGRCMTTVNCTTFGRCWSNTAYNYVCLFSLDVRTLANYVLGPWSIEWLSVDAKSWARSDWAPL